jgi:5-methylcytosine-specific restriction enzyme A
MPTKPPTFRTRAQAAQAATAQREYDTRRRAESETRRLYNTAAWARIRRATLEAAHWMCETPGCRAVHTSANPLHCDHVNPHRGDPERFFEGPFKALCETCHNAAKQREERARG